MITGTALATALAALLFVLAPVEPDATSYTWPAGSETRSAALPLLPGEPERMTVHFGCADVRALEGPGLLLSTTLPAGDAPESGAARHTASDSAASRRGVSGSAAPREHGDGLVVSVAGTAGDRVSVTAAGRELVSSHRVGSSCRWRVVSDGGATTVSVDGERIGHAPGTPIVTGLHTDLDGPTGLRATVVPDTRYESKPGPLKLVLGVVTLVGLGAVFALVRRWDRAHTPAVRLLPARWWRPRGPDTVVALALLAWLLVGSPTVDDGYIVTMLKAAEDTGFIGNYFRWFNAPESPFSWFYELYRPLAEISGAVWWLRLPSMLLGVVLWLCLDRLLLPRLVTGPARGARWCAAAGFLLWYVQFGIGLRPEPWVMLGTLLVFVLVERAVATRALTPLAAAVTAAAATVAVTPTGLVALAPFVAALVPLSRLVRRYWPVVVPVSLACGASALLLMVADQSLPALLHSVEARTTIGPNHGVLDESLRYEALFEPLRGGLNRRMPLLLLWLSMAVLLVLLLTRRTPGLAPGPTRRALVVTALFFGALACTPTKYFHHFGAIGALAAALLAAVAHTVARGALRRSWQHALVVLALTVVTAVALEAPVRWWFLATMTVPWSLEAPNYAGVALSEAVLAGGLALTAVLFAAEPVRAVTARVRPRTAVRAPAGRWRARRTVAPLLAVVAACTVVLEVGSMAVAMVSRSGTYSVAGSTIAGLGGGCGIEEWLTVEPDVAAGVLTADGPPARLDGFTVNGGFGDRAGDDARTVASGGSPTGAGGRGPAPGARGAAPPEPYGTARVPAWGSGGGEGGLTTAWYALPAHAGSPDTPPLVVPVGGNGAASATVQFADADGVVLTEHRLRLPTGTWREARLDPAGASRVRMVAEDDRDGAGWVAVGAPRLPEVVPLTEYVPAHEPVVVDWVDAFFLPCRRPASVAGGVTEPVRYRLASGPGDRWLTGMSFSRDDGGPYAPLVDVTEQTSVPTYLRGDKLREPISLFRLDYPVPALDAAQR